jgi:hypothetical protein
MDDISPWHVIGFLFFCLIMFAIFVVYQEFTTKIVCINDTIMSVGGCDRSGDCGIMTTQGYKSYKNYPAVGEYVQVNCHREPK